MTRAKVTVGDETVGEIGPGLLVFAGVGRGDSERDAAYLAEKIANLRIFRDDEGKFNRSLLEVGGSALVVSQFTLFADARKGRRPNFIEAAPPEQAEALVDRLAELLRQAGLPVATGRFQARMLVELVNEGPVTIMLDSKEKLA